MVSISTDINSIRILIVLLVFGFAFVIHSILAFKTWRYVTKNYPNNLTRRRNLIDLGKDLHVTGYPTRVFNPLFISGQYDFDDYTKKLSRYGRLNFFISFAILFVLALSSLFFR